jgi:hypothetical protein
MSYYINTDSLAAEHKKIIKQQVDRVLAEKLKDDPDTGVDNGFSNDMQLISY